MKGPSKDTRPYWKLGRITELISGNDGIVRSVRLVEGEPPEQSQHSICHLYNIELTTTHFQGIMLTINLRSNLVMCKNKKKTQ